MNERVLSRIKRKRSVFELYKASTILLIQKPETQLR